MAEKNPHPTPLSDLDGPSAQERHEAARMIASIATDAEDCALLLDALGLRATDGLPDRRDDSTPRSAAG